MGLMLHYLEGMKVRLSGLFRLRGIIRLRTERYSPGSLAGEPPSEDR